MVVRATITGGGTKLTMKSNGPDPVLEVVQEIVTSKLRWKCTVSVRLDWKLDFGNRQARVGMAGQREKIMEGITPALRAIWPEEHLD